MDTKEKILYTALSLFARDGYEAVSISEISGALGLAKSAIYKHYKNKRELFDCIVREMERYDYARIRNIALPEGMFADMPEIFRETGIEKISAFAMTQFMFWTENEFAANFRKLLSIERMRNDEMERMYQKFLGMGPLRYVRETLGNCMALTGAEADRLAFEFYAPIYMLIDVYDAAEDKHAAAGAMRAHIEEFISRLKERA